MKYILFNDTSYTNNPGCQGTVACLRELLVARGMTCLRSHPVNFGAQRFRQTASAMKPKRSGGDFFLSHWRGQQAAISIRNDPRGWDRPPLPFDQPSWETAACQLERDYYDFFTGVDAVVINGEGTIHHNLPGAATLVAWARAAARYGLPVVTVNCTIQAMDPFLLEVLFEASKRVVVREAWTFDYLRLHGYDSVQASDALFAWPNLVPDAPSTPVSNRRRCIYSPGVLAADDAMTESIVSEQVAEIINAGWDVSYLTVEVEDERFEATAKRAGARVYPLRRWTPAGLIPFLREHDLVISGRYHVMIFAWLAGRPVVPMMSNSWKIEGLVEMVGISPNSVQLPYQWLPRNCMSGLLPEAATLNRLCAMAVRNAESWLR